MRSWLETMKEGATMVFHWCSHSSEISKERNWHRKLYELMIGSSHDPLSHQLATSITVRGGVESPDNE